MKSCSSQQPACCPWLMRALAEMSSWQFHHMVYVTYASLSFLLHCLLPDQRKMVVSRLPSFLGFNFVLSVFKDSK